MRIFRFVLLTCLAIAISHAHARAEKYNVAGNVFVNTLIIQTSDGQGTGFTIDVDNRQYLITARHIVDGMGPEGVVGIGIFDDVGKVVFKPYTMQIFRCGGSVDIAVLIPPVRLTFSDTMEPVDSSGFIVGQDAYFVGFPFRSYQNTKLNTGRSRPIGFVKRGLISGVKYQDSDDTDLILLDGYNVFGFSGSPVTYWELPNGAVPAHSYVVGVVSGFVSNYGKVMVPKEIRPEDIKPEDRERGLIVELPEHPGHVYRLEEKTDKGNGGKESMEMVALNTGIVRTYSIQAALKLIKLHPIGPIISK
jgi:Trypsin-like peptidase domain